MKKYILLVLILVITASLNSQNRFFIVPNVGYFIYHSDNDLPLTAKNNLTLSYGLGAGFEFNLNSRFRSMVEIIYYRSDVSKVNRFYITDAMGHPINITNINMCQQVVSVDASLVNPLNNGLIWGWGPAFSNINHTVYSPKSSGKKLWKDDDAFNVWGIGLQAFLRIYLNEKQSVFAAIKLRCNTALYKLENGRDLSGYDMNFLHAQLTIGLRLDRHKSSEK